MCTSYFLEESNELSGIAYAAAHHRLRPKMLEKLGKPLITRGEVFPGAIVPVIAPDRKGESRVFPMVWGFTGKVSIITSVKTESVEKTDVLKEIFSRHRCIIPSSWYFEREHLSPTVSYDLTGDQRLESQRNNSNRSNQSATGNNHAPSNDPDTDIPLGKPYLLQTKGSAVTFLAGIYRIEETGGIKVPHFVILTKEAPEDIRFIHSRMPLILDSTDSNMINGWIDPGSGPWILGRIINNSVTNMIYEQRNAG